MKLDYSQILLSSESQQQIDNLFERLETLVAPLRTLNIKMVKNAIALILQGEMSVFDLHGASNKMMCKLLCELIKHIQSLEAQLIEVELQSIILENKHQINKKQSYQNIHICHYHVQISLKILMYINLFNSISSLMLLKFLTSLLIVTPSINSPPK